MNRDGFEARVLDLWMTTRVPLTRATLQFATRARRKQVERWLDEMLADGVLDIDNDDDGEVIYTVRGAARPASGPTSIADVEKLRSLTKQVGRARRALVPRAQAPVPAEGHPGHKSVVASAALSFVLGPVGWLYAAPLREAIPAAVLFALLYKLLPMFLFAPLLGVLLPISAIAGAGYAWAHNQSGERASLSEAAHRLGKRDRG